MRNIKKPKEDERTKLILHFNISNTLIIRDYFEYNNIEYSLKKIICSQLWGKPELKGESLIFKQHHQELEFDSSKITDKDMITYLTFLDQEYPIRQPQENEDDIIYNTEQKRKKVTCILDVVEPNNPGVKFKKQFEDMKKKIRMDDKISQDFNFKLDNRKLDYKSLTEPEKTSFLSLDENEKYIFLFKNAYHHILVSFFNMILQLTKNKRRFVIIFRIFDIPLCFAEEFIYEFNSFCNGKHPKYCGQNGTQLQKLDGTNKNKDFRIGFDFNSKAGENVGYFIRNSTNSTKENLVWDSLNDNEQDYEDDIRDHLEEVFEGEEESQQTVKITKGYNDIFISTYERLSQYCSLVFQDDSTLYKKTKKQGKLMIIDPYDYETLNILFDNIDDTINEDKVDIIDIATGRKLRNSLCLDKYLVNVDPRKAIIDQNYFLNKIELCENNRQTEISLLTAKQFPQQPVFDDFDLKKEIHKISADTYLEMTVFPLLSNALSYVDLYRPNDPLVHIANYMLKNKEGIKDVKEFLVTDFNRNYKLKDKENDHDHDENDDIM